MQERVDLGECQAIRHQGDAQRCAVLLPGHFYPTQAPLLWFARETVLARGWSALEVLGLPAERDDPLEWERACAERAVGAIGTAQTLVIGKSMASLLAGWVVDLELPAIWLTPLLTEAAVVDGLAGASRPTLLIGGTADDTWRPNALPGNAALEVLEVPGADHALQTSGDPAASLDALSQLTEAITRFLARL